MKSGSLPLSFVILAAACRPAAVRPAVDGAVVQDDWPVREFPLHEDSVRFAVIADSGTGDEDQRRVAEQMTLTRRRFPSGFVLILEDNRYGDEEPDDYAEKFERPYAPLLGEGVDYHACSATTINHRRRIMSRSI